KTPEKRERNKRLNQNEEAGCAAIDNLFLFCRLFCDRPCIQESGHHANKRSSDDHCSRWRVPDDQQLHSGRKQLSARNCDCNIRHSNTRTDSNADTNASADTEPNADASNSDSKPNADTNANADADTNSDADTASANATDCINRQLNRAAGIY